MDQKQVKITGLTLNHSLGIIEAKKLVFDKDNKLIIFKGATGEGKTTLQKGVQLGTQGSKTLTDNQKYGDIDLEVPLLDGDLPVFIGCKSKGKSLQYTLYIKDANGKKVNNPVIDGIEATPSSYLSTLQTELTWKMDELTSESPSIQKKILLKLYQSQLKKIGVIFDKNHPDYGTSILGKLDKAVSNRDEKDYLRKTKGGIADDLKAKGHDPDRPATCPDLVSISEIETEIKRLEKEKNTKEAAPEAAKQAELSEIKVKAGEVTNKCLTYNSELKDGYDVANDFYSDYKVDFDMVESNILSLENLLNLMDLSEHFPDLKNKVKYPEFMDVPKEPIYIQFEENGQVAISPDCNSEGQELLKTLSGLRVQYANTTNSPSNTDISEFDKLIEQQEKNKKDALEINKIVDAIDSFHQWRKTDVEVARLKLEYVKLLAKVDTGVEGLQIEPIEDDIFLMYNGAYDPKYFHNENLELRKLSSYSGTQKPVICLLIQNYLLSKKPKAMRYMYIDDVPIDNKTRALLESMTEKLNLHIFLNITGDFEQSKLQKGEILIKGGEIFF